MAARCWMLRQARGHVFLKASSERGSGPLESPLPIRPFPRLVEVPAASRKQELPSFTAHCKEKPFLSLLLLFLTFFHSFAPEGDGRRVSTLTPLTHFCPSHRSPITQGTQNKSLLRPKSPFFKLHSSSNKPKEEADVLNPVEKQMIYAAAAQKMEAIPSEPTWKAAPRFPSRLHFSTVLAARQVSKTLSKHFHVD